MENGPIETQLLELISSIQKQDLIKFIRDSFGNYIEMNHDFENGESLAQKHFATNELICLFERLYAKESGEDTVFHGSALTETIDDHFDVIIGTLSQKGFIEYLRESFGNYILKSFYFQSEQSLYDNYSFIQGLIKLVESIREENPNDKDDSNTEVLTISKSDLKTTLSKRFREVSDKIVKDFS